MLANTIVCYDLLIYSTLINIIMYVFLSRQKDRQSHSTQLFQWFILSVIIASILELCSWLFTVEGNVLFRPYQYISNVLFFCSNLAPVSFGLLYLDYIIFVSRERSRRKLPIYLIPVYLNIGLVILNFVFDGFLFQVDAANVYHRGIAAYIGNSVAFLLMVAVVISFFRNKQMITGRITQTILSLIMIPVIGVVLQMLCLGLSLSLPAYTLAIFIAFLLMERNELLKDPLTLLNSRIQMEERLRFKLKAQEPFTAIMIDVNDFKNINDLHGHTAGDTVLKDVAKILFSGANYEDFVCRFGGDEFFVILESTKDIGSSYIKRINEKLSEYSENKEYVTSLSYGLVYVDHSVHYEMEELVQITDQLMYKDKANRRQ